MSRPATGTQPPQHTLGNTEFGCSGRDRSSGLCGCSQMALNTPEPEGNSSTEGAGLPSVGRGEGLG